MARATGLCVCALFGPCATYRLTCHQYLLANIVHDRSAALNGFFSIDKFDSHAAGSGRPQQYRCMILCVSLCECCWLVDILIGVQLLTGQLLTRAAGLSSTSWCVIAGSLFALRPFDLYPRSHTNSKSKQLNCVCCVCARALDRTVMQILCFDLVRAPRILCGFHVTSDDHSSPLTE